MQYIYLLATTAPAKVYRNLLQHVWTIESSHEEHFTTSRWLDAYCT
jgi:hypothetical protein